MSFKQIYHEDPAFRAKHNQYMTTKVLCPCGTLTSRSNMTKHRSTKKHKKFETNSQKNDMVELISSIEKLSKKMNLTINITKTT